MNNFLQTILQSIMQNGGQGQVVDFALNWIFQQPKAIAFMKRNDEGAKYAAAVNQGEMKAGIACNAQGICRLENSLSQLHQNQYNAAALSAASLGIINSQSVNQQKIDTGLGVLANQGGQILQTLNRAAIPSGFYTQAATAGSAA